jgi:hypothetical protein
VELTESIVNLDGVDGFTFPANAKAKQENVDVSPAILYTLKERDLFDLIDANRIAVCALIGLMAIITLI